MATKKAKKVVLKGRYDSDRRQVINDVINKVTMRAEHAFGLGEIAKSRYGLFGRKSLERCLSMMNDWFVLNDDVEGLGFYQAHLTWFSVEKDKDGDPMIALKINVVTIGFDDDGKQITDNTRPCVYETIWCGNVIDSINDIFDKLDDAIFTAEQIDYNKLPKKLQG